jgi:hypothetical protein
MGALLGSGLWRGVGNKEEERREEGFVMWSLFLLELGKDDSRSQRFLCL